MAVPDRNRILFHHVFRAHHRVRRAMALSFRLGRSSYTLRRCIRYSCVYTARMSPTLSGSSALQRIKLSDALEIRNGIISDFYSRLPHMNPIIFQPQCALLVQNTVNQPRVFHCPACLLQDLQSVQVDWGHQNNCPGCFMTTAYFWISTVVRVCTFSTA